MTIESEIEFDTQTRLIGLVDGRIISHFDVLIVENVELKIIERFVEGGEGERENKPKALIEISHHDLIDNKLSGASKKLFDCR